MKVNVASTIKIVSSGPFKTNDTIKYVRAVAGKKAIVEVANTAMGVDLVAAARAAFAIDPSVAIAGIALVMDGVELDDNKALSALGIKNGSSVQIVHTVQI